MTCSTHRNTFQPWCSCRLHEQLTFFRKSWIRFKTLSSSVNLSLTLSGRGHLCNYLCQMFLKLLLATRERWSNFHSVQNYFRYALICIPKVKQDFSILYHLLSYSLFRVTAFNASFLLYPKRLGRLVNTSTLYYESFKFKYWPGDRIP
jgi:hypothetical protein